MKIVGREEIRGGGMKRPRLIGYVFRYEDGTGMFVAIRKHKQIFKDGCSSISEAIQEGKAAWTLDERVVFNLRAKRVKEVVFKCDNGDKYRTDMNSFLRAGCFKTINPVGIRGGSIKRAVSLSSFKKIAGEIKL